MGSLCGTALPIASLADVNTSPIARAERRQGQLSGQPPRGSGDRPRARRRGAVRRLGDQPGGLSGHPLGARRADRAGAARAGAGSGRAGRAGGAAAGEDRGRLPGGLHGAELRLDPLGRGAGGRLGRGEPDAAVPARVRAVRALAPARAQRGAAAGGVDAGDDRPGGVRGAARERRRRQSRTPGGPAPRRASRLPVGLRQRERGPVADGVLAGAAAGARGAAALERARAARGRRGAAGRGRAAEREPRLAVRDPGDARARVRAAAGAGAHVRAARAGRGRDRRLRAVGAARRANASKQAGTPRRRCTRPPRRRSLAALAVGLVVALGAAIEQRRSSRRAPPARVHRGVGALAVLALVAILAGGVVAAGNPVHAHRTRLAHVQGAATAPTARAATGW